jgi:peptidylprolyl isomerase
VAGGTVLTGRPDGAAPRLPDSVAPVLPRHLIAPALLVLLPVALVACGGDDDTADTEPTTVTDIDLEPIEPDGATDDAAPNDDATTTDNGTTASGKPDVDLPDAAPTELVVTDLVNGTGPAASSGDTVVVDYVGVLSSDGTEFDNSYDRGVPFSVPLGEGRVIAGWDEGLVGVQTGGRRQLDIPAELAYGDNPPGGSVIQAGDALTFVVDVRAVIGSVEPEDAPTDLDIPTSSGRTDLDVVDVVVGDGPELEPEQTAIAHLLLMRGDDLEVLESTWNFNDPAQIVMVPGGAIDGLVEGMLGMQVGGMRVITMPPSLAFGPDGVPDAGLPGDSDVIIVAELVGLY